jgi:aryl-alcohol dehydrogenase-like predicted oxidoreductase
MKYRRLGYTDLNVSEIGFGCWALGSDKSTGYGKINLNEAIKALDFAFDSGINMFDTAALYGNGFSESILGKTFKKKKIQNLFRYKRRRFATQNTIYASKFF